MQTHPMCYNQWRTRPPAFWMSTDLQKHHLHKGSCFCVGRVMSAPLCSEPPASCVQDAWVQSNKLYPGLKEVLLQCQYPWCAELPLAAGMLSTWQNM